MWNVGTSSKFDLWSSQDSRWTGSAASCTYWTDKSERFECASWMEDTARRSLETGSRNPRFVIVANPWFWKAGFEQSIYLWSLISISPQAIAVHPAKGYLYFTDWSLQPYIGRMALDGSPGSADPIVSNYLNFWIGAHFSADLELAIENDWFLLLQILICFSNDM